MSFFFGGAIKSSEIIKKKQTKENERKTNIEARVRPLRPFRIIKCLKTNGRVFFVFTWAPFLSFDGQVCVCGVFDGFIYTQRHLCVILQAAYSHCLSLWIIASQQQLGAVFIFTPRTPFPQPFVMTQKKKELFFFLFETNI